MKKIYFAFLSLFLSTNFFCQDWRKMMQEGHPNFYEIQKAFNQEWEGKNTFEKGNGYNLFKRWEYYVEKHVFPSGDLSLMALTPKNYAEFIKQNPASRSASPNFSWSPLGPIGSMYNPSYPGAIAAGRLDFVRIDPNNPAVIYTGSPSGGLWKSTNGGQSWTCLNENFPVMGCTDIAIDPSNSNNLYVVTGDAPTTYNVYSGIYKSTDGGNTWNQVGFNPVIPNNLAVWRLIIHPTNPQILLMATNQGIYRTINGVTNWVQVSPAYCCDIEFKTDDPNTVFASGVNFSVSTNNGQTFTQVNNGIPNSTAGMKIGVTPNDPNYVYAVAINTVNYGLLGFYQSTNAGNTFANISTTINLLSSSPTGTYSQGIYCMDIAVSPLDKNEVFVGGYQLWRTTNAGASWDNTFAGGGPAYSHPDQHAVTFHPSGDVYICNDGGILKYAGGSLYDVCGNMNITEMYAFGLSSLSPSLMVSGHQDNGTGIYNGANYLFVCGADGMDCFYDRTNDQNVYASIQNSGLLRSVDGGNTWLNCGWGFGLNGTAQWFTPYKQDPVNASRIYVAQENLQVSNNSAQSWGTLTPLPGGNIGIADFVVAPSNNSVIYVLKYPNIVKTTDAGMTWTTVTNGVPIPSVGASCIIVDPDNENNVWVCQPGYSAGNKIHMSVNGGASWTNISYNLPNIPAHAMVFQPGSNGGIFLGMARGVYYCDNTMNTWTLYNTGLPNVEIRELAISPAAPDKLRAGTYGRGIYEMNIPVLVTAAPTVSKKSPEVKLYPNPAGAQVSVETGREGNFVFDMNDVNGKLLLSESFNGSANINTGKIQAGIYYYSIKENGKLFYSGKLLLR